MIRIASSAQLDQHSYRGRDTFLAPVIDTSCFCWPREGCAHTRRPESLHRVGESAEYPPSATNSASATQVMARRSGHHYQYQTDFQQRYVTRLNVQLTPEPSPSQLHFSLRGRESSFSALQ